MGNSYVNGLWNETIPTFQSARPVLFPAENDNFTKGQLSKSREYLAATFTQI